MENLDEALELSQEQINVSIHKSTNALLQALPPPPPPPPRETKQSKISSTSAETDIDLTSNMRSFQTVIHQDDPETCSSVENVYHTDSQRLSSHGLDVSAESSLHQSATWPSLNNTCKSTSTEEERKPPAHNKSSAVVEGEPGPVFGISIPSEHDKRAFLLQQERVISPVSSAKILHDQNLAEKVDAAISLAAEKLEQQVAPRVSQSSKNEDSLFVELQFSPRNNCTSARNKVSSESSTPQLKRYEVPEGHPSPFEAIVFLRPTVIGQILDFLGDPVEVCTMKTLNKVCFSYIDLHQHKLMQTAVRLGGISMSKRPAFWMWLVLSVARQTEATTPTTTGNFECAQLVKLQQLGRAGKWSQIIERDVSRSFGNLPPHKTGARLRTDSIVRALVSWGRTRTIRSGVRGAGPPPPLPIGGVSFDSDDITPTDTVSDWGGVSPSASFGAASLSSGKSERKTKLESKERRKHRPDDELALSGNVLTDETKELLQKKLSFILHALSASHPEIGYCQGMDYVVAHLLRLLQDTVRWQAAKGTLPSCIFTVPGNLSFDEADQNSVANFLATIDGSLALEETCFRMMDVLLTHYNLGHFYWPELRCLKTCCRVFEKLIQIKLPVLADHFEHHELNVGLFALGWFQTLFLYLPSMPTATVCHMWDIWLVERSFKIFFRVATAILFLSQPILLNHELEGMMSYLNTFPDATLLSPDILIACALQIKVTNSMLMELEQDIVNEV
jgi:hypothetical protein